MEYVLLKYFSLPFCFGFLKARGQEKLLEQIVVVELDFGIGLNCLEAKTFDEMSTYEVSVTNDALKGRLIIDIHVIVICVS